MSFAVLGWTGWRVYQEAPPIPLRVVTTTGEVVIAEGDISAGQNAWQAMGGMEQGSIWGHGSYVAPDWTADWLHREATFILDEWSSRDYGRSFSQLDSENQSRLQQRLQNTLRPNRYDATTGTLVIDEARAHAPAANSLYFASVFRDGRPEYAIARGTLTEPNRLRQLARSDPLAHEM
ncbi:MAG: hypothetical protein ACM3ZE_08075 [Myxococcales bacterium]